MSVHVQISTNNFESMTVYGQQSTCNKKKKTVESLSEQQRRRYTNVKVLCRIIFRYIQVTARFDNQLAGQEFSTLNTRISNRRLI